MAFGTMLTILLVDAELELIPEEMLNDRSIAAQSRKRKKSAGKMLLDSNFMHTAIDRFHPGESNRRGRPDIIHHFLTMALESILNKRGQLRVWIHTRTDRIIEISPEIRLPKSYNRFVGLVEDLYDKGEIRAGDSTLLKLRNGNVDDLLSLAGAENVKVLSPTGERTEIRSIFEDGQADQTVIMGGFSEGDYRSDIYSLGSAFSIFDEELTIWTVASELIAQYERDFDLC